MFNNRQSDIIEKSTYQDEFESNNAPISTAENSVSNEATAFNSRIPDNFDRILHYDLYSTQQEVRDRNETYHKYTNAFNSDVNPSSTTMQFKGVNKTDIYRDLREDNAYQQKTTIRPRGKFLIIAMASVIVLLSVLVVFNTALLNNMNNLIQDKTAKIERLRQEETMYNEILDDVSSDETVINSAKENGMID